MKYIFYGIRKSHSTYNSCIAAPLETLNNQPHLWLLCPSCRFLHATQILNLLSLKQQHLLCHSIILPTCHISVTNSWKHYNSCIAPTIEEWASEVLWQWLLGCFSCLLQLLVFLPPLLPLPVVFFPSLLSLLLQPLLLCIQPLLPDMVILFCLCLASPPFLCQPIIHMAFQCFFHLLLLLKLYLKGLLLLLEPQLTLFPVLLNPLPKFFPFFLKCNFERFFHHYRTHSFSC